MATDAGDYHGSGKSYKLPSDGTGSKGDVVKPDGSGQVTPTTADGDGWVGVLAEDSPANAGDEVGVHFHGRVEVTVDGAVSATDHLEPAATSGRVVASEANEGFATAVDEGGTDTYDVYTRSLMALEDASAAGETVEALVL